MNCFVCNNNMRFYFQKKFEFAGLETVDYFQCSSCGFVISKTHLDMSEDTWGKLNADYHLGYQKSENNVDDPNWLTRLKLQKDVIYQLSTTGLLNLELPWVDYGCGDGKLADLLTSKGVNVLKYDRFLSSNGYLSENELLSQKYGLVINTSVFEHVLDIKDLDYIASLVDEDGVLAVHTWVGEEVPRDPEWFYLLPVHCSFYTNESMQILFERWGFKTSIYHPDSRLWFWFKKENIHVEEVIQNFKSEKGAKFHFKKGFMDYWK
ncbi:class I SAM-dependent methyltransferase [Aneurinibacillus uraniidurans]|uniref:class I SAM-dependent methyltransferase n=1 Tax=Aneurinibacillus uraniidurans TaxID=2966586 RepID=UPI00234AB9C8|nr:class I SAM-dependent methyltransferase [Aneurinibacillus sp. B1]WCN36740.1 class I SAM-dependent methyltransferase [Aneurinibacillus sp. B1]